MPANEEQKSPIQVIDRMMRLLDVLAQHPEPLGLKQISQYTGLHPSTAHRILSSMSADRLVDRVEPGSYRLGMRLLELGNLVKSRISVRELALPMMRELHAQTGETANLSVRHGDEIVYVERTSSGRSAMRVVHVIGARARCTSPRREAFLLEEGFARLRDYAKRTGLAAHTRNTLSNLPLLERELERIQRQGWATDNEEAELGVRCVAAGIRDDAGTLVAALSLSTPADRMKVQWGPLVKETAERISRTIGHRPPAARIGAHLGPVRPCRANSPRRSVQTLALVSRPCRELPEAVERVLVGILGVDGLARCEMEAVLSQRDVLCPHRYEVHLDPALGRVVEGVVAPAFQVEVRSQLAVDARKKIQIERGGHAARVVVGGVQHRGSFRRSTPTSMRAAMPRDIERNACASSRVRLPIVEPGKYTTLGMPRRTGMSIGREKSPSSGWMRRPGNSRARRRAAASSASCEMSIGTYTAGRAARMRSRLFTPSPLPYSISWQPRPAKRAIAARCRRVSASSARVR